MRETLPGQTISGPAILVVDEDEAEFRALSDCLIAGGYRAAHAYTNSEALERARIEAPALILLDIQTPGMEGFETIQRIHADPTIQRIPVVAFAALSMLGDRERCFTAGGNEYMRKPIQPHPLLKIIAERIGRG